MFYIQISKCASDNYILKPKVRIKSEKSSLRQMSHLLQGYIQIFHQLIELLTHTTKKGSL